MNIFNRSLVFLFSLICLYIHGAASEPSVTSQLSKAIKNNDLEHVKNLFQQHTIDANKSLENGYTPLCLAVAFGSDEMVKYLVEERKADVNMQSQRVSPVSIAAANGHLSILKYLIEERRATLAIANHRNILSEAVLYGEKEVVDYLIERPDFQPHIDGAIALSIATDQNHASIIDALHAGGVPQLPKDETPCFFYDDAVNKTFNIKPMPLVAYSLKDKVHIYQLKVAQQEGALADCVQERLKDAARKLGGSPEDHQQANPIYGGSCGYQALKNSLLGLLMLTDYDQLAQSYVAEDKDKQLKALEYLKRDIESLKSSKPSHDFDPLQFIEKIHAKIYKVVQLYSLLGQSDRPKVIQQSFGLTRQSIIQNKVERIYDTLISGRFPTYMYRSLNAGKISFVNQNIMRELRFAKVSDEDVYDKNIDNIINKTQLAHLREQVALFRCSDVYRHAFVLSYDTSAINGYGNGMAPDITNAMHAMSIILDKRGSMVNVLLLESNNVPDLALKQIIFDFIEMFTDAEKYPLTDSEMLCQSAQCPFDVAIDIDEPGMVHISRLIKSYVQTKDKLKAKVERDTIHKALYLFENIKHLYKKALSLEENNIDAKAKHIVLNQFKEDALFEEMPMLDKEIRDVFRREEIALHQMFEQLEQEELNQRLHYYIMQDDNLTMIKEALEAGADPEHIKSASPGARKPEIVDFFFQEGHLDIESKLADEATLLMQASYFGNIELLHLLLDKGADVHARDACGATPVMYTAFFPIREQETIDLLIKHGADVHATNNQGQSLADMFFKQGQIDMVEYLIKKYGVTLHLEEVVSDNSITLASYSRPQFLRLNCLHYLIKHFKQQLAVNLEFCQKLLLLIIKQNDVEMLDVFFATNLIDPNYQDKIDGWTPLMHAVKARSFTVFKYLIEKYKVDTTLQNEDGKTAFDIARANEQIIDRGIFSRPDPFIKYINEIA